MVMDTTSTKKFLHLLLFPRNAATNRRAIDDGSDDMPDQVKWCAARILIVHRGLNLNKSNARVDSTQYLTSWWLLLMLLMQEQRFGVLLCRTLFLFLLYARRAMLGARGLTRKDL
ncbi:hypothetical protein MRB53_013710 [Persea americana]|uniref:Uncharacterized protein n=1 Tax=Persea americana TaxID=3435 RepID=A0ACC2K8S7_PERAE|nr:hypothetical protein MRB53_013710 [Persea americana]